MRYTVVLSATAESELRKSYRALRKHAPRTVGLWLKRLLAKIDGLEFNPQRCPIIEHSTPLQFDLRELTFGRRRGTFRILFTIQNDQVLVRHIYRATRNSLSE